VAPGTDAQTSPEVAPPATITPEIITQLKDNLAYIIDTQTDPQVVEFEKDEIRSFILQIPDTELPNILTAIKNEQAEKFNALKTLF